MEPQGAYLVLGGPGHLQIVSLAPGQETYAMESEPDGSALAQTFVYRIAKVGAGAQRPIGFLVPAHLRDEPELIAGWVFNKLVQSLMKPHPMVNHLLCGFNFVVSEREDARVLRAEVRTHIVGANGIVRLAPVVTYDANKMIDRRMLADIRDSRGLLEAHARDVAWQAFKPLIEKAVHSLLHNQGWT